MKKKILILGASGMLGVEVLRELSLKKDIILHATIRSLKDIKSIENYLGYKVSNVKFHLFNIKNNYQKNLKKIIKDKKYIINCIGIIKPYIDENSLSSIENAIRVNSNFPHILNKYKTKNTKVFQIATDCVYDGFNGGYNENNSHNARDVYGKTKSLGEVKSLNFYNLRCSIIGKEIKAFKSLLCWFTNQKKNSTISGYTDHLWNGITTRHFARIVTIIIFKKINIPNLIHITPNNIVNKYQLLKIFQKKFNRQDLIINKTKSKITINRTLSSKNNEINKKINKKLGYRKLPTIKELVQEII